MVYFWLASVDGIIVQGKEKVLLGCVVETKRENALICFQELCE